MVVASTTTTTATTMTSHQRRTMDSAIADVVDPASSTSSAKASSSPPQTSGRTISLDHLLDEINETIGELERAKLNDESTTTSSTGAASSAQIAPHQQHQHLRHQQLQQQQPITSAPPQQQVDVYSLGFLTQRPGSLSGHLHKFSSSRDPAPGAGAPPASGSWKRRYFVLADYNLFLFRSDTTSELPVTFLPLTGASGSFISNDPSIPSPTASGFVIDFTGHGTSADGHVVDRQWTLLCPDERTMNLWLDRALPAIERRRRSSQQRSSVGSNNYSNGVGGGQLSPIAAVAPLLLRRPSDFAANLPPSPIPPPSQPVPALPMSLNIPAATTTMQNLSYASSTVGSQVSLSNLAIDAEKAREMKQRQMYEAYMAQQRQQQQQLQLQVQEQQQQQQQHQMQQRRDVVPPSPMTPGSVNSWSLGKDDSDSARRKSESGSLGSLEYSSSSRGRKASVDTTGSAEKKSGGGAKDDKRGGGGGGPRGKSKSRKPPVAVELFF